MAKNGHPVCPEPCPIRLSVWPYVMVESEKRIRELHRMRRSCELGKFTLWFCQNVSEKVPPIVEHRNTAFSINLRGCLGMLGGSPGCDAPQRSEAVRRKEKGSHNRRPRDVRLVVNCDCDTGPPKAGASATLVWVACKRMYEHCDK